MVDFCFGLVFILSEGLSVLHKSGAKLGQLLPLIYWFFFLSECTLVMETEIFSLFVHINTCFSGEAFLIHSLFLHSDAKLVKFKT